MRSISERHPSQHHKATENRESRQNRIQFLKLLRKEKWKKNSTDHECNNKPVQYSHLPRLVRLVTHYL